MAEEQRGDAIETFQAAGETFPPAAATVATANAQPEIYARAAADPETLRFVTDALAAEKELAKQVSVGTVR